jgi:hypothetical protein
MPSKPGVLTTKEDPPMPTGLAIMEAAADLREQGIRYRGLCTQCVHAAACTFPRDPSRPIRSCEEFEEYPSLRSRAPARAVAPKELGAEEPELKGLCRHCAVRISCTFPKPEGGIWHCDELV